jgi:magnesium-transporting ATPase (P-type)
MMTHLQPLLIRLCTILSNRYVGLNSNKTEAWPYLADLDPPDWDTTTPNWLQMFFLYVTLLSNFIPLSMYVTVEATNFFFLWLIYVDLDLYDATTDTRGLARSTNVTDLGQIQYIFSDKTGTLTQNVMRFKRCSVDGMAFGAPIQKVRPGAEEEGGAHQSSFHPLRQLMVGRVKVKETSDDLDPLAGYSTTAPSDPAAVSSREGQLTFNSEMFLRVLSLCHTVVVEKDLDLSDNIDSGKSVSSQGSSWSGARNYAKKLFGSGGGARNRTMSDGSAIMGSPLGAVPEDVDIIGTPGGDARMRTASTGSYLSSARPMDKGPDGSPAGFAYQAESPDEGALVSAASQTFGFQVIGRDSSGIKIRSPHPTILRDEKIVKGLKSGALTPKSLAAATSAGLEPVEGATNEVENIISDPSMQRIETWTILAVNKFDSDRKRMSILLRSPHELGDIPILFCKGADSAMLDPEVCSGAESLVAVSSEHPDMAQQQMLDVVAETSDGEDFTQQDEWELAQMLGIQSHLGEFASEGLRTLVLGVRFLTENECTQWLETYNDASTSIKNRDQKLTDAALQIERKLHIVGATAIEDKLQVGVPKTIATLAKAGIKLWVLTGDKRETAIEIGYSTAVLTPKMHLTEVADKGPEYVRAQCAMEFIRLVKAGKLPKYQRAAVDKQEDGWSWENFMFAIGKANRRMSRMFRRCIFSMQLMIGTCFGADPATFEAKRTLIEVAEEAEKGTLRDTERRRRVRDRAEKIIKDYLESPEGQKHRKPRQAASPAFDGDGSDHLSLSSDEVPGVFNRAQSARLLLDKHKTEGKLSSSEIRSLSLAQLTAQQMEDDGEAHLIDEDTLSLNSFFPNTDVTTSDFDKKKRTLLERLFAVDKEVRRGRLIRHMKKDKRVAALASPQSQTAIPPTPAGEGPRALVIEGAALKYLLGGEPELEELIFSVASSCDAVIACRVSPRQKALLVNLVRHNVFPEPVTLAIGDGANDVGMIQEAHVGVGISGKEGTQAVNASDFAIAQFRFLEDLVLVHGRWNFFRLSTVVLFSFYKNAVMAGCLVVFNGETVFSGTPLFDEWVIAMLNFVAGIPILVLGLFDRCLEKDYVRKNPEVYQATRDNELITRRVLIRWVLITFTHIFVLYYCIVPQLSEGGGMTTAFVGLMRGADSDTPGEGEGGDLQSVGSIVYTCMILILAYKVSGSGWMILHNILNGFFAHIIYSVSLLISSTPYTFCFSFTGALRVKVAHSRPLASVHMPKRC